MEKGKKSPSSSQELMDSVLCVPGSRMITSGLKSTHFTERIVKFVNAGGGRGEVKIGVNPDSCFQGGDVLRTEEIIANSGEFPSVYQTARFGNFRYKFNALPAADYLVDLHFAEIVNTYGPKGMRVFDVFIQEEKVLCELDIYSIVGANKPLQVVGIRVSVGEDGEITLRFEGVVGCPIVSGICIRRTAEESPTSQLKHEYLTCNNCAAEIKIPFDQGKVVRARSFVKYEQQIQELKSQCQLKTDECYEAWMSLTSANQQLEKVRMELDNSFFQNMCLDQAMRKQTETLKDIFSQWERDKRFWATVIQDLEKKVKIMKHRQSQLSSEAHKCTSSIPDLSKMIFAVQALVAQYEDLKLNFNKEQEMRKELHNQLQVAKGNIRVFCRCRPSSKEEELAGYQTVVDFTGAKDGELGITTSGSTKIYKFDRVYTPKDDQDEVFVDASFLVTSVLDGYNACIFAYGQTGTGKTFTMEGVEQNRGVNYRTLQELFKIVEERKETVTYDISVSVLEVYNEQIRDLLATSSAANRLEVKQMSEGLHHVPGIVEAKVGNITEAWDVLQAGSNARAVGSNNVNEHSSRSHCLLCMLVRARNLVNGECTVSKLWLVDLAGSERLAKTEVQGERLKEAQNINRSLSALGNVISALGTKSSHVPYRNSKLTHLLQDSLGGDSKTLMFVQISPSERDLNETLGSLNFATRVRGVELGPPRKQIYMGELEKIKVMLDKAKQELRSKDDVMHKLEENLQSKANVRDQLFKNQQDKVHELETQLASRTELCRKLEKQVSQLSEGMKRNEEICFNFQHKVKQLEDKLTEYEQTDPVNLQFKVDELEKRLKERTQEFELYSRILQQQVKDLENKLNRERDNSASHLLQQKVPFLSPKSPSHGSLRVNVAKEKLRRHEQEVSKSCSVERLGSTPLGTIASRVEILCEIDPNSQRSLKNLNIQSMNHEKSILLKGPDSLRELRRKRSIEGKGSENNFPLSTPLLENKILSAESDKARQLDPSRALARLTRNTKPTGPVQKRYPGTTYRGYRDQVSGIRESASKQKVWLR